MGIKTFKTLDRGEKELQKLPSSQNQERKKYARRKHNELET